MRVDFLREVRMKGVDPERDLDFNKNFDRTETKEIIDFYYIGKIEELGKGQEAAEKMALERLEAVEAGDEAEEGQEGEEAEELQAQDPNSLTNSLLSPVLLQNSKDLLNSSVELPMPMEKSKESKTTKLEKQTEGWRRYHTIGGLVLVAALAVGGVIFYQRKFRRT